MFNNCGMNEQMKGAQKWCAVTGPNASMCENEFILWRQRGSRSVQGIILSASKIQCNLSANGESNQINVCPTLAMERIRVGAFKDIPSQQENGEVSVTK